MNKENIYKFWVAVSFILLVVFAIQIGIDYSRYNRALNSAPFSAFLLMRGMEFVLPSLLVFLAGMFCKNKFKKENRKEK